ncbi:MAG TPA: hypothetical protein VHZ97_08350 [Pseudonocardiaceae bacterium]|nr:hypothetical protein [Pseudonocardiaceae bacterium]
MLSVLSMVLTAVGVLASRLRRGARLTVAVMLAAAAGAIVPLALIDLVGPGLTGVVFPLVLAVIGMEIVAAFLLRSGRRTRSA